jgi:membrane protein DedA with SNARE-associated domain
MHAFLLLIIKYSYVGIFIALGFGIIGLPVPDESLIAYTGFLSSQGKLDVVILLPVLIAGTSLGITVSYLLGRYSGRYLSGKYNKRSSINAAHLQNVKDFYGKYGGFALLIGYFIPGVRHLTAIFAGMNFMSYRRFAFFAYIGALLWTATFLTLGYWLGHQWHLVSHFSNRILIPSAIGLTLGLFLLLYLRNKDIRK